MTEYIEREKAIENFMQYTWYDEDGYAIDDCDEQRDILESMFAGIPAADVRPVVRGEWVFGSTMGHSRMKCSNCLVSQGGQTSCFSYCPNCGADMREEQA